MIKYFNHPLDVSRPNSFRRYTSESRLDLFQNEREINLFKINTISILDQIRFKILLWEDRNYDPYSSFDSNKHRWRVFVLIRNSHLFQDVF